MSEELTRGEKLAKQLLHERVDGAISFTEEQYQEVEKFAVGYKKFLDHAKTEREAVETAIRMLEELGYHPFERGIKYAPGDRVYLNNRGKALIFATIGTKPICEGVHIMASHVDSPRIDLKPHPLVEDSGFAMFKTHYYGGIKKFQWPTLPLALHGVICRKDGTQVTVTIGEEPSEPVFCITDLLPHLAADQQIKPLAKAFNAENFNVLVGTLPFKDDKVSEKVKLNVLRILFEKYGVTESDFLSAELTMVPAGQTRDVGLDGSLLGAYGHDDKVCAYTSMMAAIGAPNPETTHITIFADKEETGSDGNTGMNSAFLRYFIDDLAEPFSVPGHRVLSASKCLSADVNCAYDPTYPEVTAKDNSAQINHGVVITKYTGSGGKYGTSDASAEYMAWVRAMLDEENVLWQTGELGKVDVGGGGTVAKFIASLDVDTVDLGVPVLSMHAPFELISKIDLYSTYRAFLAFARKQ